MDHVTFAQPRKPIEIENLPGQWPRVVPTKSPRSSQAEFTVVWAAGESGRTTSGISRDLSRQVGKKEKREAVCASCAAKVK